MRFIFVPHMKNACCGSFNFVGRTCRRKRNFSIIDTDKSADNILYVIPPASILKKHISVYLHHKYLDKVKHIDITSTIIQRSAPKLHNWKSLISKFRFLIALFSKRIIYITLYAKNGTTFCLSKQTNVIYHRLYYEQVYRLHLFKIPS